MARINSSKFSLKYEEFSFPLGYLAIKNTLKVFVTFQISTDMDMTNLSLKNI